MLYDVCNDYSLSSDVSEFSRKEAESDKYEWQKKHHPDYGTMAYGYHKFNKELHYVKSPYADLDGLYL